MEWRECHNYIIPSDNREQQPFQNGAKPWKNYIIPSDNREQQLVKVDNKHPLIISYQAITGNNNYISNYNLIAFIISYQAITGNNNL